MNQGLRDQLPGVRPILHEGRISGSFDLLASDMQQVEYEGRVVLVLIADVAQVVVKTVKGDQTAFWTFKGEDAAIVRDEDLKEQLVQSLHLDDLDLEGDVQRGPTLVGEYDDEGAFLGFREDGTAISAEREEYEDTVPAPTPLKVDEDTGEVFRPAPRPHPRHSDPALESFLYGKEAANV